MSDLDFKGQGWAFPPAFVKGLSTTVVLTSGDRNIQENLQILFNTRIGERLMNFNYGTKLKALVFENQNPSLFSSIKNTITNALVLYEPRIKLESVDITNSSAQDGLIEVQVTYTVLKTNHRANFVYPFYISEGTHLRQG